MHHRTATRLLRFLAHLFVLQIALQAQSVRPLTVLSFNIRFDNPKDAPNDWPNRRDKVASQILFHEADVIGFQEPLHRQLKDLESRLPGYRHVGAGSDDGKRAGTHAAIFFEQGRLQLHESATFWLSETPTIAGSKHWDSAHPRIVTWARFTDRVTAREFYVFNTHFDHKGVVARVHSARILLEAVVRISGSYPAIITGDFNTVPESEPIQLLTASENPLRLIDSKSVSEKGHYGPTGTFNGFQGKETSDLPIDFIFIRGPWRVLQHATLSETWGGLFSSDHFPVLVRLLP